jgi:hypothetical protein
MRPAGTSDYSNWKLQKAIPGGDWGIAKPMVLPRFAHSELSCSFLKSGTRVLELNGL